MTTWVLSKHDTEENSNSFAHAVNFSMRYICIDLFIEDYSLIANSVKLTFLQAIFHSLFAANSFFCFYKTFF